ncbi:MAG: hypothetical protein ABIN45_04380 [Gammaproteobacteria bacterium]
MKVATVLIVILAAILFSGCDNRPKTEPEPATIFKEERQALDKAKGVQQTIDRQAEEQRKKIDEAEKAQ